MSMRSLLHTLVGVAAIAAGLTSCASAGGGNNGTPAPTGPVASTLAFPTEAITSAFFQTYQSHTLTAKDSSNNTYTFISTSTPGSASTFESQPAETALASVIVKRNGVTAFTGSYTDYFQVSPYKPLGRVASTGEYIVATFITSLPTAAKVGQSGAFAWLTGYTNSAKTVLLYNESTTWSLEADTATTAWYCMNSTVTFVVTTSNNYTVAECLRVNGTGSVLGMRMTSTQRGVTLSFQ